MGRIKKEDLSLTIIKNSADFVRYFIKYCYIKRFLKKQIAIDRLIHLCKSAYRLGIKIEGKEAPTKEDQFVMRFRSWIEIEGKNINNIFKNLEILAEKSDLHWMKELKEYNSLVKDIPTPDGKPTATPKKGS